MRQSNASGSTADVCSPSKPWKTATPAANVVVAVFFGK
jgi:hypothetical protein